MSESSPADVPQPLPITEISVTEVSLETGGALPARAARGESLRWSTTALWMSVVSVLLAPLFGAGVVPGILSIIVGHIAKYREPRGIVRSGFALGLGYLAIIIGTAVLIFVTLPLAFAFLVSAGYLLAD